MRKIMLMLFLMLAVTGCGKELYAGSATAMPTDRVEARLNSYTEVNWYDGQKENKAEIEVNVKYGKEASDILRKYNTSFIPFEEYATCTWIAVNLKTASDETPHVFIVTPDCDELVLNGIKYNGSAYKLEDGWYAAAIPNGLAKYNIVLGDKLFPAEVKKDIAEVNTEVTVETTKTVDDTETVQEEGRESAVFETLEHTN